MGGNRIPLGDGDEKFDFSDKIQDDILNKTLLKTSKDNAAIYFHTIPKTLKFDHCKQTPASFKSRIFKGNGDIPPKKVADIEARLLDENDYDNFQRGGV